MDRLKVNSCIVITVNRAATGKFTYTFTVHWFNYYIKVELTRPTTSFLPIRCDLAYIIQIPASSIAIVLHKKWMESYQEIKYHIQMN